MSREFAGVAGVFTPPGFTRNIHARTWRARAHRHRHSAIGFVTPAERHAGSDIALLRKRTEVYEVARKKHPERWSGTTRNWQPVPVVHLNPDQHVIDNSNPKEDVSDIKMAA